MTAAPVPPDEDLRLKALLGLDALDTQAEAEFDALVKAAALICGMPISLVSLIDHDRQWFKANIGLPGVTETPREVAFCAHAILGDDIFEIPDAMVDPRFSSNPLVLGNPDTGACACPPRRHCNSPG
jgi:GAF domain-containing protein